MIFAVSAKSPDALLSYIRLYLAFCETAPASDFRSICYTSCVGREMYRYRFSCVVKDLDGLVQRLKDRLSQVHSSTANPSNLRIILAFPGQGSQFYGMANALTGRFSEFREILIDAASKASSLVDFDVLSFIVGTGQPTDEIDKSAVAQICVSHLCSFRFECFSNLTLIFQIFVYQYSVCQFLRKLNIAPDAVVGNSLGEISAAGRIFLVPYHTGPYYFSS
jgi:acyl transferase domain-containing protein